MSGQYRFMRYYLPGSLMILYMISFLIVNLSEESFELLVPEALIGIFSGAFVASPTLGYLLYSFYTHIYEHWEKNRDWRTALTYIDEFKFIKDQRKQEHYKRQLRCFLQKKEFLDLIYHSTLDGSQGIRFDQGLAETLKNHLSIFAARFVCGLLVPVFCIPLTPLLAWTLGIFGTTFTLRLELSLLLSAVVCAASFSLLLGYKRILFEAYQLEAYYVRAKRREIESLLQEVFAQEPESLTEKTATSPPLTED